MLDINNTSSTDLPIGYTTYRTVDSNTSLLTDLFTTDTFTDGTFPAHVNTTYDYNHGNMPFGYTDHSPDLGGDYTGYIKDHGANNGHDQSIPSGDNFDYSQYYEYYEDGDENGTTHMFDDEYPGMLGTHYLFKIYPFEVSLLGYVRPILVLLTAITNVLVIGAFMSRRMRGKATNIIFVSIAISDTFTGLVLLPNSFHIYAENRVFLTMFWCNFSMVMRFYVSRVFHTISVWQTVLLGIQRFLCVCHPFTSSRFCTVWKTVVIIVVMYVGAAVMHAFQLTSEKIWHVECMWHVENPCTETCIYLWFCALFQHLVPVLLLMYLTARTIYSLKKASKRVSVSSRTSADKRSSRDKLITITTTCIVIVFLIPELPNGIFKIVLLATIHRGEKDLSEERNHMAFAIYEIFLIISFHLNFWIYCIMMRDFRQRVFSILTLGRFQKKFRRERVMSNSSNSRQGTLRSTISRTSSDASTRHRITCRNLSLPSTASDINGIVSTPQAGNVNRFKFTGDKSVVSYDGSDIPMLSKASVGESFTKDKPPCDTQMSMEVSGDINEDDVFL